MQIVRAQPDQAGALTEIAHFAKKHWGYPEKWIEHWRSILTIDPEVITANPTYCAIENNRIVGFYSLTSENGKLRLDHLWIVPEAMSRGIGRALFQHAIEEARSLGHKTVIVEADPNAEGFYKRMGTRRIGETVTIVGGHRRELPLLEYDIPNVTT